MSEKNPAESLQDSPWLQELEQLSSDNVELLATNQAMTICVALRSTQAAVATGHDVSLLREPSQKVLSENLFTLPITDEPDRSTPAGRHLFDHYCQQTVDGNQGKVREFLAEFTREIDHYACADTKSTIEERYIAGMNLMPAIHQLTAWNECYIDQSLDNSRLAYEGGDISGYNQDVYRQFGSKDYLELLMKTARLGGRTALSGQVRLRLLSEMDYLSSLYGH